MTDAEKRSVVGLCIAAAFADESKSEVERAAVKRVADSFQSGVLDLPALYQDVLLRRVSVAALCQPLASREVRQLAYEMALGVCEADANLNEPERAFLRDLQTALELDAQTVAPVHQQADAVQDTVLELPATAVPPVLAAAQPVSAAAPVLPGADVDKSILNYAILNGALELLPETLATMAIVPLQMKMVYGIGRAYGYELDRGHIKEFAAAAGVGLTAQVVEGYATKLVEGLLKRFTGGFGRAVGAQATGSAMAFASTYALGQLAKRYYAGGRTLSGMQMRQLFDSLLGEARGMQQRYLPQIQARSQQVNLRQLLPLVRGS